jgi:hypothetical protein
MPEVDLSQFPESDQERIKFALNLTEDEIDVIRERRRRERADQESDQFSFAEELEEAFHGGQGRQPLEEPLPPGSSPNPDRRREQLDKEIEEAMGVEPPRSDRFAQVLNKKWKRADYEPKVFLKEKYGGKCQICGYMFIQRNGEPYFEGLHLVSTTKADWLDHEGNVLCLCANCCAKMQHGTIETQTSVVEQLMALRTWTEGGDGDAAIEFVLCGEPVRLSFHDDHLLDVQELLRVASFRDGARETGRDANASQVGTHESAPLDGTAVEESSQERICPGCGRPMPRSRNFCTQCGTRLE